MRTQQVKNSQSVFTVPIAGAAGAVAGYALKYALPITANEHDGIYNSLTNGQILQSAARARTDTYTHILKSIEQNSAAEQGLMDVFVKSKDLLVKGEEKKFFESIADIASDIHDNVEVCAKKVFQSGADAMHNYKSNLESVVKKNRPTAAFVALGAMLAMSAAIIYNSVKSWGVDDSVSVNKDQKDNKYTDENMIFEMPDGTYGLILYR